MSTPHLLNQAVVTQALHDLRNGQLRRCLAMGFGEQELEALKQPALVSLLVNARVPWCSVKVNRDILKRLVSQMTDIEQEISTIDRMLRLGASTEMVVKYYGLTHQEVALRRDVIGLPKRKGRHPVLSEEQEVTLWRNWELARSEHGIHMDDETVMLAMAIDVAESMQLPLAVIWASLQNWIDQGLIES
jgi:hypothetical protein